MNFIIQPSDSGNILATVAIGEDYLKNFKEYALPGWLRYCERYNLGLVVFENDLLDHKDLYWKKANWQKLLIGKHLRNTDLRINNICHLDTDILISPEAPNIFNYHEEDKISLVSQIFNLPYPDEEVRRRIAFFRHRFYSREYPLDSALFANLDQIFSFHGLQKQSNYFCTGVFIFNLENHTQLMHDWFYKYPSNIKSITGGGEEAHLNFEIQKYGKFKVLDYKFQALWTYEMAWKYPFLYDPSYNNSQLIRQCIEASLYSNYFLHFAGSWFESEMWKIGGIFGSKESIKLLADYASYLKAPITGEPKGVIKPIKE